MDHSRHKSFMFDFQILSGALSTKFDFLLFGYFVTLQQSPAWLVNGQQTFTGSWSGYKASVDMEMSCHESGLKEKTALKYTLILIND